MESDRQGGSSDEQNSADELAELRELSQEDLANLVENKISDTLHDLCNYDEVASEIAMTNAVSWGLDVFDVLEVEIVADEIIVHVEYQLHGDQEEDKPWCGTTVSGAATAVISLDGTVEYRDITAERDLGEPYSEENDEEIFRDESLNPSLITDPIQEIRRYLAKHPEKLYDLNPRRFEELIAEILKDFGFETELTPATRDGGRDIYAYVRNAVTSFLMFVECKKWAKHRTVGIDVVQRLHGAAKAGGAHKAMIVTTSFFTLPAQQERGKIANEMDLADYDKLKTWLADKM